MPYKETICAECNGAGDKKRAIEGKVVSVPCHKCDGTGKVQILIAVFLLK
jgi:DnaJ-class molecular chaperone